MLLADKVALITGAARGTGAGIARVFAREGACVVINQVKDEGHPRQVLEAIQSAGGKALMRKTICMSDNFSSVAKNQVPQKV